MPYAIGVDYGTNSVRAVVADTATGHLAGTSVFEYPSGEAGVILDPSDVNLARQHPQDWIDGFFATVPAALAQSGVSPDEVVGIGIDTTGSTPLPVDADGTPLALKPEFAGNKAAMAWLWKDHTGHAEAEEITERAEAMGRPFLAKVGGTYSSEWFWSKILRCARVAPDVFAAAHSWVEFADYIPAYLTGATRPAELRRGICPAGHKALYHRSWGGLPDAEFLATLDPRLAELRPRLFEEALPSDRSAGGLTPEHAVRAGLRPGTPVAVGAFDAHLGAVGSGVRPGTLVKIMGTSTCDIMVGPAEAGEPEIKGVCGVVPGSVIPGLVGIEAGQSAVGDLFAWVVNRLAPGSSHAELSEAAAKVAPGASGLLALDWNNGNRTILVDPMLTGLLVGSSLQTTTPEVYRAMLEATAFGALMIVRRIEESGVPIEEVVCCGGIAERSPLTMQIYADILDRPIKVAASPQTCALGSAIAASVVGGAHPDFIAAISAMVPAPTVEYRPDPKAASVYRRLAELYRQLHDAFGTREWNGNLGHVMKDLIAIRDAARHGNPA